MVVYEKNWKEKRCEALKHLIDKFKEYHTICEYCCDILSSLSIADMDSCLSDVHNQLCKITVEDIYNNLEKQVGSSVDNLLSLRANIATAANNVIDYIERKNLPDFHSSYQYQLLLILRGLEPPHKDTIDGCNNDWWFNFDDILKTISQFLYNLLSTADEQVGDSLFCPPRINLNDFETALIIMPFTQILTHNLAISYVRADKNRSGDYCIWSLPCFSQIQNLLSTGLVYVNPTDSRNNISLIEKFPVQIQTQNVLSEQITDKLWDKKENIYLISRLAEVLTDKIRRDTSSKMIEEPYELMLFLDSLISYHNRMEECTRKLDNERKNFLHNQVQQSRDKIKELNAECRSIDREKKEFKEKYVVEHTEYKSNIDDEFFEKFEEFQKLQNILQKTEEELIRAKEENAKKEEKLKEIKNNWHEYKNKLNGLYSILNQAKMFVFRLIVAIRNHNAHYNEQIDNRCTAFDKLMYMNKFYPSYYEKTVEIQNRLRPQVKKEELSKKRVDQIRLKLPFDTKSILDSYMDCCKEFYKDMEQVKENDENVFKELRVKLISHIHKALKWAENEDEKITLHILLIKTIASPIKETELEYNNGENLHDYILPLKNSVDFLADKYEDNKNELSDKEKKIFEFVKDLDVDNARKTISDDIKKRGSITISKSKTDTEFRSNLQQYYYAPFWDSVKITEGNNIKDADVRSCVHLLRGQRFILSLPQLVDSSFFKNKVLLQPDFLKLFVNGNILVSQYGNTTTLVDYIASQMVNTGFTWSSIPNLNNEEYNSYRSDIAQYIRGNLPLSSVPVELHQQIEGIREMARILDSVIPFNLKKKVFQKPSANQDTAYASFLNTNILKNGSGELKEAHNKIYNSFGEILKRNYKRSHYLKQLQETKESSNIDNSLLEQLQFLANQQYIRFLGNSCSAKFLMSEAFTEKETELLKILEISENDKTFSWNENITETSLLGLSTADVVERVLEFDKILEKHDMSKDMFVKELQRFNIDYKIDTGKFININNIAIKTFDKTSWSFKLLIENTGQGWICEKLKK